MKYLSKFILFIGLILIQFTYSQSTVYVKTNQFGRGILKMRGSETYVITPEHLLKDYYGPITIHGKAGQRARAELLKTYIGDLAVLRFSEAESLNATKWELDKNYSAIIETISEAYVELREEDGSASKVAVSITGVDVQFISIKPEDYKEKFYQGMSGSSLFVNYQGKKVFLGMLQSIADDENGSVIRADEMEKILGSFFNPVKSKKRSNVITDQNMTREVDDFKFNLMDINKSADKVTFTFEVTNLKEDREITLKINDVFMYENSGLEYKAKTIIIGNKSNTYSLEYNLVKATAVPINIIFTGVSSSAEFASLLSVGFSTNNVKNSFEYKDLYFGDNSEDVGESGKWSKEELGFKFGLESIEKRGQEVVFTLSAESLDRDKLIKIYIKNIFMYDDRGSEYNPHNITIGNKSNSYSVEHNLIKDIKAPIIMSFKNVNPSAKAVSLLKVGFSDTKNNGVFQIRNLTFPDKTISKTQPQVSNPTSTTTSPTTTTTCSEIYFYRKMSMLEYDVPVYLYNHGELITKLEPGMRFKTTVCNPDRSFAFSVRTNPNEIALSNTKPEIEMGKKYYLKINCAAGISAIKLMDTTKGNKDVSNDSKFKRSLTNLELNEY